MNTKTEMQFFNDYAEFVAGKVKEMGSLTLNLHHMTTGISGEAGEALDITKKMWVYGQELNTINKAGKTHRAHLEEELGDALFYIQGAANLLGVNLLTLIELNMMKLNKRYPTGYSDQAALVRADKEGKED